ncbi:hypothetical protein [Crenalkalicoccus roseus]|uniref:hypothetical protein n=1 Tax=Crenalkalicoccus roseus TaxID=1485588 RepID=UPI00108023F5|nr:hypothetical protein [Crenalkalicoccus roseus]
MSEAAPSPRLRYQRLAAARGRLLSAAAGRVPRASLAQQARTLALWDGRQATPGDEAQHALLLDLGVLDPVGGHLSGLERQARAAPPEPGSDEAAMLEALRRARFGLWRVLGPHPEGGARLAPLEEGEEVWVMDGFLGAAPAGALVAARLAWPAEFAMTCGVVAAADARLLERLLLDLPPQRGPVLPSRPAAGDAEAVAALLALPAARQRLRALLAEPGLAARTYRHALDLGLMGPVPGRTPPEAA